ncbi:MAG TPA: hypothetical protein VMF61_02085 [Candidatus Acidoferrales bacterium]|nr:hypothetical protein [Candidatus Acidoferrales bacterium]
MYRFLLPLVPVAALMAQGCSSSNVLMPAAMPAPLSGAAAVQPPGTRAPAPADQHLPTILPRAAAKLRHHGRAKVVLHVHWKHRAVKHRAHYLPATARSISISINGGLPQYLNAPAEQLTVNAPVGIDTFLIQSYDEQNGLGNVVSLAYVTQNIIAGQSNQVNATLNAVVASFTITLTAGANAGAPASVPINVTAFDPDGNVIVGPGDYNSPIVLSIDDPAKTGTLTLSTTDIYGPGVTSSLTYTGETLTTAYVDGKSGSIQSNAAFSPTPTVYEFPVAGEPQYITAGSDGNMWFTDNNNTIVKIAIDGTLTPYAIPTGNADPQGATLGENGSVWFTEFNSSKIAQVTPQGAVSEFGTLFGSDEPELVTDRGDGTIWYTGYGGNHIGYVNEFNGVAGETTMPTGGSGPWGIAEGPDGNLYVTENLNDDVARFATLFTYPAAQTAVTSGSESEQMVLGPDGNLWFTQSGLDHIGQINPSSFMQTASYATYSPSSVPVGITAGKDGALWYTESGIDRIARMTTAGVSTGEYDTLSSNTGLKGIATAPDGSIWFCESNTSKVGRLVY